MTGSDSNVEALSVKLGTVQEYPTGKWILTGIFYLHGDRFEVWTPVPAGEEPENLGRTFQAAWLSRRTLAFEVMTEWPRGEGQTHD